MFQLYFGGLWPTLSTLCLCAVLAIITAGAVRHQRIQKWGRMSLLLGATGLLLCCLVVMRDDYVSAVMGTGGVFGANSPQVLLAYGLTAVIVGSLLFSLIVRRQSLGKGAFFVLSGAVLCKALLIEVSRILLL